MQARLLSLILLATVLAGCSDDPAATQIPPGRIDGAVLDHLMQPYGNVSVHLVELDIDTQTTKLGGFSFIGLEPGFYTLEVTLEGGTDRELVIVENETAKIILQVERPESDDPTISIRSHPELVKLAMPGEHCEDCEWTTPLRDEPPEAIEAVISWDGRHPFLGEEETLLEVELRDGDGTLVAGPFAGEETLRGDLHTIYFVVPGSDLASDAHSLSLHFHFADDNTAPHPDFEMESFLYLHYGESDRTRALLA